MSTTSATTYEFVAAVNDESHPEHAGLAEWIGRPWDPNKFDIDRVNAWLNNVRRWPSKGPRADTYCLVEMHVMQTWSTLMAVLRFPAPPIYGTHGPIRLAELE